MLYICSCKYCFKYAAYALKYAFYATEYAFYAIEYALYALRYTYCRTEAIREVLLNAS